MKFLQSFLLFSTIALFSFVTKKNYDQQWVKIGEKKVSFLVDRDVIHVTGNDNFSQLKFKVKHGPAHFLDVDIHFENGDKFDVSLKQRIPMNGETRVIDLPGGNRNIKKIEFWYETKGIRKGRGTVEVWGRR